MQRRTSASLIAPSIVLALALVACGSSAEPAETTTSGDETPPPVVEAAPPPPEPAHFRVIHAAFDPSAATVALAIDGEEAIASLGYQFASAYVDRPAGSYTASLSASGTELASTPLDLDADGGHYTALAYSTADAPVALAFGSDVHEAPSAENASLRFFHGVVGLAAIDVCAPGASARADGTPIFVGVEPGTFAVTDAGAYASVAAGGELTLQLRAHHATPCHGRVQGVARFTPVGGSNYTLVAVGRTTGRPRVDRELLYCADPPATDTSCATAPIAAH